MGLNLSVPSSHSLRFRIAFQPERRIEVLFSYRLQLASRRLRTSEWLLAKRRPLLLGVAKRFQQVPRYGLCKW